MNHEAKATEPITCECGFRIWDSEVVRSRVLRLTANGQFEAKCRCKRWVMLPVMLESGDCRPESF